MLLLHPHPLCPGLNSNLEVFKLSSSFYKIKNLSPLNSNLEVFKYGEIAKEDRTVTR